MIVSTALAFHLYISTPQWVGLSWQGWETVGVVFIADDLGAWLVGLLADAGCWKLTALVLGDDQERALRRAATAAVEATAAELDPVGGGLAMVISEVFAGPVPSAALADRETLLEGLKAGVAAQLAVLGDAEVTGTAQSSADVSGVSVAVVAERLADYLVGEIMLGGSHGGPLAPLADQLNHDRTHLQGRQLVGMVGPLADDVREGMARAARTREVELRPVRLAPRPAFLAGREDLLGELDARLAADGGSSPRVVALCGLGGAGKTSVAVEYAHRHLSELGVVWQFAAEEPTALAAGFGDLAGELGVWDLLAGGIRWRRCTGRWRRGRGAGCWCSTM